MNDIVEAGWFDVLLGRYSPRNAPRRRAGRATAGHRRSVLPAKSTEYADPPLEGPPASARNGCGSDCSRCRTAGIGWSRHRRSARATTAGVILRASLPSVKVARSSSANQPRWNSPRPCRARPVSLGPGADARRLVKRLGRGCRLRLHRVGARHAGRAFDHSSSGPL